MRINKFIAASGVASRRQADLLIQSGKVTVNGAKATVGQDIEPEKDHIKVDGKLISIVTEKVYVLMNKPAGVICSASDESGRQVIFDLLRPPLRHKRLFSIGRLDYTSEGLIILTNDGDYAARMGHPSTAPEKTYQVRVSGVPTESKLDILRNGVALERYKTKPCKIRITKSAKNTWVAISLKEGRNKQIREMFEHIGHSVIKLRRAKIGGLTAGGIKPGEYRLLSRSEIDNMIK